MATPGCVTTPVASFTTTAPQPHTTRANVPDQFGEHRRASGIRPS